MEKLKYIIEELNKIFTNDYNCFTFSNLTDLQLQQVVLDLMHHLKILETKSKHESLQSSALEILSKLESIKYTPEEKIHPEEFRNGLFEGKREIIYPILDFLLRNTENAVKRYYLSKYVTKIEIPNEILQEEKTLQILGKNYEILIEEFWYVYGINKREKGYALESAELEEDIWQMRIDMSNLHKRLNQQKEKLEREDVREKRLQEIRDFCHETKRNEKMNAQLDQENSYVEGLKETARFLVKRKEVRNLEDFLENVESNRHTSMILDNLCKELEADLKLVKKVGESNEPNDEEISMLHETSGYYQHAITMLKLQTDDSIEACLNQLKILGKKHSVLSKQVVKIQAKNDSLVGKIEQICSLLGGDVLSGKSLREYVSNLRHTSLIYKDFKKKLNSLQSERGNLSRTLEILHLSEPQLKESLEEKRNFLDTIESEYSTETELKNKIRKSINEFANLKPDYLLINEKYRKLDAIFKDFREHYNNKKSKFEEAAGNVSDEIERVECDYEKLKDVVAMEFEDLNRYVEEAENYKERLLRYSQFIIENTEDVSYLETVEHKLEMVEARREGLREKVGVINSKLEERRAGFEAVNGVKEMVLLKLNSKVV